MRLPDYRLAEFKRRRKQRNNFKSPRSTLADYAKKKHRKRFHDIANTVHRCCRSVQELIPHGGHKTSELQRIGMKLFEQHPLLSLGFQTCTRKTYLSAFNTFVSTVGKLTPTSIMLDQLISDYMEDIFTEGRSPGRRQEMYDLL